jgi:predicted outer membrane repeat protein
MHALLWVALIGCKGDDEVLPAELGVDPPALDFADVAVGTSADQAFTVRNTGDGVLHVLSVSLATGDSDAWTLVPGDARDLDSATTLDVTVTFAPQDEADAVGSILVRSDAGDATVELSGTGTASTLDDDGDGYSVADGDCDDGNADVHPGADEGCNGRDDDCDGSPAASERDDDGDRIRVCEGDCDDGDAAVGPGMPEICDDKDSDCDGTNRDHADSDGDGLSICDGDCDDTSALAFPGGVEVCDGHDNDCDGTVDTDDDGDGHSPCTEAGDCDDHDRRAHPIVVDASAVDGQGDGTDAHPFTDLEDGEANIEPGCHTIWLAPGTYVSDLDPANGPFDVVGATAGGVRLIPDGDHHVFSVSSGATLTVTGVTIADGTVGNQGGGVQVDAGGFVARDVAFEDNTAPNEGGALYAANGSTIDLEDCTFTGNHTDGDGGAISVTDSTLRVVDSLFDGNTAGGGGGDIAAETSTVTLERDRFWRSEAIGHGGGVDLLDSGGVVRNDRFQDLAADLGGGLSIRGGAVALAVVNNTFAACASASGGAGIDVASDPTGLYVAGDIVMRADGESGIHGPATAVVEYTTVVSTSSGTDFDGPTGTDDRSEPPGVVAFTANGDPTDDDLALSAGSPSIDSGPPDAAYDDVDGSVNDRGFTGGPAAP